MHIHQLDLNLFAVFEAIHSEGSVTQAGQKLNLTQPAISHSLGRLRDLLKDEPFIRNGKKMVPTPLSRSIIAEVRNALYLLEVSIQARGFDPARSNRLFQIGWRNLFEPAMLLQAHHRSALPGLFHCVPGGERDQPVAHFAGALCPRVANVQLNNCVHPFPMKIPKFGVYLYWHSTADADPENRWLREQVVDLFA